MVSSTIKFFSISWYAVVSNVHDNQHHKFFWWFSEQKNCAYIDGRLEDRGSFDSVIRTQVPTSTVGSNHKNPLSDENKQTVTQKVNRSWKIKYCLFQMVKATGWNAGIYSICLFWQICLRKMDWWTSIHVLFKGFCYLELGPRLWVVGYWMLLAVTLL